MSPGNLYRYFASKDALVAGLCERDRVGLADELTEMRESGGDFIAAFRELGRRHFNDGMRDKAKLCLEIWAEATRNPEVAEMQTAFDCTFEDQLVQAFEVAKQQGAVAPEIEFAFRGLDHRQARRRSLRQAGCRRRFRLGARDRRGLRRHRRSLEGRREIPQFLFVPGEHVMKFSRILAAVVIIAATLWIGSGVFGRTETPPEATTETAAPAAQPLFQVAVIAVHVEEHSRGLLVSGRTEADNRASAVARTTGSIVELKVDRGDVVRQGDVLATLSDEARDAQVAEAEALVQQRKADLDTKLPLIKRGIVPANDKNQLEADLRSAEASLAAAEAERERGLVRAPISGVVSDVPMTTGQAMQPNMTVAEVIALDPMLAVAEIAERQLGEIKVGDTAEVRLVTGQRAVGKVRYVSPTASSGTRTYRVEVELDNADHAIADGVTAEVKFQLPPVAAVRVPRSALTFSEAGKLSVRTVGAGGIVASVPVSIVEDAREDIWLAGPKDGDMVIVQGQDFVKDGQKVQPVDATKAPAELLSKSS